IRAAGPGGSEHSERAPAASSAGSRGWRGWGRGPESPQRPRTAGENQCGAAVRRHRADRDARRGRLFHGGTMNYALVTVLGLFAGVISGLFGIGGAIVIVPGLVLLARSEEHTSELQSLAYLVCRLLLEKKKP